MNLDYATLGSIVEEYIIEKGYDTTHDWPRLYNIAIRGLKNMHFDVSGEPTYTVLELDENNLVDIPTGLVKIRQVAFMGQSGLVPINESTTSNPWTINQGVETPPTPQPSNSQSNLDVYNGFYASDTAAARYKNGESVGHVFAGGGGNPYFYRVNYDTNKFEFSSNIAGSVVVDYTTNPLMVDSKFRVHPFVEYPLLLWLEWKDKAHRPNTGIGEKQVLRKQYFDSKRHAKMQFNSRSTQAIRNGQRRNYKLTPK